MDIEKAIIEFKNYTNEYLKHGKMMKIRLNHTFKVVDLCEMLARALNLSDEEIFIAKIIGLLHDIGRFEQWRLQQNVSDINGLDHADLSVAVLQKDNYIRNYIENKNYDEIIMKSIKYHNKYAIPKDLTHKETTFLKIIRDADMIDLLRMYIEDLEIELDSEFTEKIIKTLFSKKLVDVKDIKNNTDMQSKPLGFVFDMNYYYTFKYIKEKGYYDKLIARYKNKTNNEKLKIQLEEINNIINNYIEENLYVR